MNENPTGVTDIETISDLTADSALFECTGYSVLKITRNGKARLIRVKIKSTGVAEFQEQLSGRAPRPPMKRELIRASSAEGKALGLAADTLCMVFDLTDEAYVQALEAHNRDFIWQVVIFALDLAFKKTGGGEACTYEEKKAVLQSSGITQNHINRIYRDVEALTAYHEERSDFL